MSSDNVVPEPDIARWIATAREGCRETLGALLEFSRRYLLAVADGEMPADLVAKIGVSDVVQDTMLEAVRDFAQFHGGTEPELLAWLRQILRHNVANWERWFRDAAKRNLQREESLAGDDSHPLLQVVADSTSPSEQVIADEEARRLERALGELSDDHRHVIVQRNFRQQSFDEIGTGLGRSPDAARMLWWRAIERLREILETST